MLGCWACLVGFGDRECVAILLLLLFVLCSFALSRPRFFLMSLGFNDLLVIPDMLFTFQEFFLWFDFLEKGGVRSGCQLRIQERGVETGGGGDGGENMHS